MGLYGLLEYRKTLLKKYWDSQLNTRLSLPGEFEKNQIMENALHEKLAKLEKEIRHEIDLNY